MTKALIPTQEFTVFENGRLFVAPTHAHDLVVVDGSILGGPHMLPREQQIVASLAAALLDAGTTKKNKSVIREALSAKGVSLSFASSGDRTAFSGRCFPEDLSFLLSTIVECLGQASFPEAEVKNIKKLVLGELAEEKSDTRSLVERAFAGLVYDEAHVNYLRPLVAEMASVSSTRRSDLLKFRSLLGKGGLVLAVVGDVEIEKVRTIVKKTFGKLDTGTLNAPVKIANTKSLRTSEKIVSIADKASVDVLLGVALPITTTHPLYHPMKVMIEMLGGKAFSAHLMRTIRERDGLTYGVYARLTGLDAGADGVLKISATFSPDRYSESVVALRKEVGVFFKTGLTQEALTSVQDRLVGSYLVSLSTTQSLAGALHAIGRNGFELSYLSDYPDKIRAVTLVDIHKASELIPLTRLSLAASGSIK